VGGLHSRECRRQLAGDEVIFDVGSTTLFDHFHLRGRRPAIYTAHTRAHARACPCAATYIDMFNNATTGGMSLPAMLTGMTVVAATALVGVVKAGAVETQQPGPLRNSDGGAGSWRELTVIRENSMAGKRRRRQETLVECDAVPEAMASGTGQPGVSAILPRPIAQLSPFGICRTAWNLARSPLVRMEALVARVVGGLRHVAVWRDWSVARPGKDWTGSRWLHNALYGFHRICSRFLLLIEMRFVAATSGSPPNHPFT
jgi:hypothetical protein